MLKIKYLMILYKICEKNLIRNKYLTDKARRSPDTDTVLWSCCWSEIFQSKSCPGRTWLPPPLLTTESLNIWVLMNFGLLFASWLGCKISEQNYILSDLWSSEICFRNSLITILIDVFRLEFPDGHFVILSIKTVRAQVQMTGWYM